MADQQRLTPMLERQLSDKLAQVRKVAWALGFFILALVIVAGVIWQQKDSEIKQLREAIVKNTPDPHLRKQMESRDQSQPPRFMNLDEFTVNMPGRAGEHYIQAKLVLRVADLDVENRVRQYMPLIRDRVIMVLGARPMAEVATPAGKAALAKEAALAVNSVIDPQLTAIYVLQQRELSTDMKQVDRSGAISKESPAAAKLSQEAVEAAAKYWRVTEMDLPVQAVLFEKLVMQ